MLCGCCLIELWPGEHLKCTGTKYNMELQCKPWRKEMPLWNYMRVFSIVVGLYLLRLFFKCLQTFLEEPCFLKRFFFYPQNFWQSCVTIASMYSGKIIRIKATDQPFTSCISQYHIGICLSPVAGVLAG